MQNSNIIPDEETFVRMSEFYGKDNTKVFFIIEKKEYEDFEIDEVKSQLETHLDTYDDEIRFRLNDTEWEIYSEIDIWNLEQQWSQRNNIRQTIDKKIICMQESKNITYLVIEWADLETFEVLGDEYGKDKDTMYHRNFPCSKLILKTYWYDNPIKPINTSYYSIENSILGQMDDPETCQIVGHYNWGSVILMDKNYLYLYFHDDENPIPKEKIRKIFHFPVPNYDKLKIYDDISDDCYIKGKDVIYNYYQEDGSDIFSVVEWVDYKTFDFEAFRGYRDKLNAYQYWKIYIPETHNYLKENEISIEDIPF